MSGDNRADALHKIAVWLAKHYEYQIPEGPAREKSLSDEFVTAAEDYGTGYYLSDLVNQIGQFRAQEPSLARSMLTHLRTYNAEKSGGNLVSQMAAQTLRSRQFGDDAHSSLPSQQLG
jgi:hypothetical protein